ncbi:MAG: tetratricopeptide repeat protein [Planctomycetes bacterium]|nr:tetratricopeptide repeat protein [Planctomycetota bacterium]
MLAGVKDAVARAAAALRVDEDARRLGALALRVLAPGEVVLPEGSPAGSADDVEALLRADDRHLDLARGTTLLACEDAPAVDPERVLDEVAHLAWALRQCLRAVPRRDPARRLEVTNAFFFEALGFQAASARATRDGNERLGDLLLPHVLRRRRGHCVGLSSVYLAVGTRAGLPLFGVSAPGHFFVRWDGQGLRRNVETTARGAPHPDEHYVERFRIARPLVDRGVYLQSLRRREVLVEVLNNRANFWWDRGDVARAARDLDRIVQVSHNFARAYVGRGYLALQRGELLAARADLARAVEIAPEDPRAHLLLGEVALRLGRLDEAERAFDRAVATDEHAALACTNLGRVHGRRGAWDEALRWHERALAADRASHVAWNNLGVARRATGDVDGARAAFRTAARLRPDFLAARENLLLLGRRDDGLGWTGRLRLERLRRAYERRLRRAPHDDEGRAAFVRLLLEADPRPDRALEVAREGVRAHRSVRSLETQAVALRRAGDAAGAAAALEAALALDRERGGFEAERLQAALERARQGGVESDA